MNADMAIYKKPKEPKHDSNRKHKTVKTFSNKGHYQNKIKSN